MTRGLRGLVFDKDGTLFDFHATWGAWTAGFIRDLSNGDEATALRLATDLGFDLDGVRFLQGSPMIAGTMEVVIEAALAALPRLDEAALRLHVLETTAAAAPIEAAPLAPLLEGLRAGGFTLGLATNDAEAPAREHLGRAGVLGHFAFVAGYDSGWGAKPAPGMLEAFCRATGHVPGEVAMIGDSTHDLAAGRAAGMVTIGVLTGPARAEELLPLADAVLPDIAGLPEWLAAR
jgi:phosphoglycolate phosphatase